MLRPGTFSWLVLALLLLVGCTAPTAPSPSPSTTDPAAAGASPESSATGPGAARIVSTNQIDSRTLDLTVESPAVHASVSVRLLLPAHFQTQPDKRWPVLYLLHGCCDTYLSWTRSSDIEHLTRNQDLIVAMPDGGQVGFYSNWRSGPQWETFHTAELPQLLAQGYRANGKAAIAGASMGGLGALGYAARHPGQYSAAASFSGIVDTRLSSEESQGYLGLVSSQGVADPLSLWGDPGRDAATWQEHNPYDLAPRLTSIPLFVSAGNGKPGRLDPQGTAPDSIEPAIHAENTRFTRRLHQLHAKVTVDLYGNGTHNWVYWQRELHRAWPILTDGLR